MTSHDYEVRATLDGVGHHPSGTAAAARTAPTVLGYTLVSPGGSIDLAADATAYLDTEAPPGSSTMGAVTATTDLHDQVSLDWENPTAAQGVVQTYWLHEHLDGAADRSAFADGHRAAPPVENFIVYRDGAIISSTVAGTSRSFVDEGADAPAAIEATDFTATPSLEEIALRWTAPASTQGRLHHYTVTAVPERMGEILGSDAYGRRSLRRTSLSLLRDGIELAANPDGSFIDTTIEGPTIHQPVLTASTDREREIHLSWTEPTITSARQYEYQLAITTSDGETVHSQVRRSGAPDPKVVSFDVFQNGDLLETIGEPAARTLTVPDEGGSLRVTSLQATDGTVDDGIDVSWELNAEPGLTHSFVVEAHFDLDIPSRRSDPVHGSSAAPAPAGIRILREAELIATLGGDARQYSDKDVTRIARPPSQVHASQERKDAVRVTWTSPLPTTLHHFYTVEVSYQGGTHSAMDGGHRKALTLDGYRILRDGVEAGHVAADALSFDDTGAALQTGAFSDVQASQGTRNDGVLLEWSHQAPIGVEHVYTVEARYAEGESAISENQATGVRAPPSLLQFELRINGGEWAAIGTEGSFLDTNAPGGSITEPTITHSVHPVLGTVYLERGAIDWLPPPASTYRIRAVYDYGLPAESLAFTGYLANDPPTMIHFWEHSAGEDEFGEYVTTSGYAPIFMDDAPPDELRWYRIQTLADGFPFAVSPAVSVRAPGFKQSQATRNTTCAIRTDDTLHCFGEDTDGMATPPEGKFIALTAGYFHFCGLRDDAAIVCWGQNSQGQAPSEPIQTEPFASLGAFGYSSCGVTTSGGLSCWGQPLEGSPPLGRTFTQIALGFRRACGILPDDRSSCWGFSPWSFAGTLQQIVMSDQFGCALAMNGQVDCQGTTTGITSVPPGNYLSLGRGSGFVCGIQDDASLRCWGDLLTIPAQSPAGRRYVDVSGGLFHACAVREDKRIDCWGSNTQGQAPFRP